MGLFDRIYSDFPLPGSPSKKTQFQTKNLGKNLDNYRITAEGELVLRGGEWIELDDTQRTILQPSTVQRFDAALDTPTNYSGTLHFYGDSNSGELMLITNLETMEDIAHPIPVEWFEYFAVFVDGKVESVARVTE